MAQTLVMIGGLAVAAWAVRAALRQVREWQLADMLADIEAEAYRERQIGRGR